MDGVTRNDYRLILEGAIPAVVMYNMFSRWIAGYRALLSDASATVLRHVSRDLERRQNGIANSDALPAAGERALLFGAALRPAQ